MAKNSIRDYSSLVGSNTDIQSVNIDEGCSPAGINNAIRELMVDLANVNSGAVSLVSPDFDTATINGVAIEVIPAGTRMLFQQTAAPTGWTKVTTDNNKALRVVSGTVGSGGTQPFTTAFASQAVAGSISGTVAGHTLTLSEIPSHNHYSGVSWGGLSAPDAAIFGETTGASTRYMSQGSGNSTRYPNTSDAGGGGSHTHGWSGTFTGTAIDMSVQYLDVIIASKD